MQHSLTRSLVFFISGVYLLSLVQPNLQAELAMDESVLKMNGGFETKPLP